jgi:hypothetical protein
MMSRCRLARGICASALGFLAAGPALAEPTVERLADAAGFRRMCEAARIEGSVRFEGDEVQRGKARAEFKRRREDVLASVYETDVPPGGFSFGEYDYEQKRLPIDLARGLRPTDGVDLTQAPQPDDDLEFGLAPEAAQAAVRRRASGGVHLHVSFRLRQSAELADPCVRLAGGRSLKVRVDPLALELVPDGGGAPLARVESNRYREALAEVSPVAKPHVQIKTPDLSEKTDKALLTTLEGTLLGCYRSGLSKNARLRGSLVVGLALDKDGRAESARPEIDAIGDPTVVSCAVEKLRGQRFPRKGGHLSLPVFFQGGE